MFHEKRMAVPLLKAVGYLENKTPRSRAAYTRMLAAATAMVFLAVSAFIVSMSDRVMGAMIPTAMTMMLTTTIISVSV
jgi:hypothetical protein